MTDKALYCSIAGCSGIQSVEISGSYAQISTSATVECTGTTLAMGDAIGIDMGYSDGHSPLFEGFVKQIERIKPEGIYRLTCYDVLVKATDYFMASDDPENPFQRENIGTQQLVKDLLAEAGISGVVTSSASFTWGTNGPAKFNLQTVADAVQFICGVVGFTLYAQNGTVYFHSRKPYIDGDTPTVTVSDANGDIISCQYSQSNVNTRNRIIVYGRPPIHSDGRVDLPYLVVDQTVVLANDLIDTSQIADGAVTANLNILARLTEGYEVEIVGNPNIQPRTIISLTESFSGTTARTLFCYKVEHRLSKDGFFSSLTLTV